MINKTMRMNVEVAVGITEVMELNPRITKESEVFPYAYHQVALDILANKEVKWDEISMIDFNDRKATIIFPETRGVSVEEEDFRIVLDHYSKRPGVKRVPFSYLTRLILLYTRKKLRGIKDVVIATESKAEVAKKVDGVSLIRQIAEFLEKDTENAEIKILKIKQILEEEALGCKKEKKLHGNKLLDLQEWIKKLIKDNKLEYLATIDDGKVDDDALTLLMKSWKTNFKPRQHVKEYEDREYAHKIYEKLGWKKDHYDVICSAWTTYIALLVNYAQDKKIKYSDFNVNIDKEMYHYSKTVHLGYWYKSNGKEVKGTLCKDNNNYPESSYYNKFLVAKNVHSEFAKNIVKEVSDIQDLSALCHCVANFMPCPDECGVGEFSYNQIKGSLPEVREYFPLMIAKIQKCVSDDTGLIYKTSNGESEISKDIIKKWHEWFLENRRKYFLDEFYYVTKRYGKEILVGIPFFKGQSLENPMPNDLCEAKECLDNILYIIQNRALKMAYFLE